MFCAILCICSDLFHLKYLDPSFVYLLLPISQKLQNVFFSCSCSKVTCYKFPENRTKPKVVTAERSEFPLVSCTTQCTTHLLLGSVF